MRIHVVAAVLLVCPIGCAPAPTVTKGTFTNSFTLTMQRGSVDVVVQTSGPANYTLTQYAMDHPMGKRPDTEATFTTPAGTFMVSNRNLAEAGLTINGTFYPEPTNMTSRSTITIDPQGAVTVQPPKATPPVGVDDKDDAKKIQGTWVVDPSTFKGVEDKETLKEVLKEAESMRFVFAGDTFTMRHPPANEEKGGFRLDPTKNPKQIDLTDSARGIYELDGDTLKLCWDQRGKDNGRPTKFAWAKDKGTIYYYVLKREKTK
jgi:uncharacterized protein (TIGR03067 family)